MKRGILVILVMSLSLWRLEAQPTYRQDTLHLTTYFRYGTSSLDLEFRDNAGRLNTFENMVNQLRTDPSARILSVNIQGGASPEGNSDAQKQLAAWRGEQVAKALESRLGLSGELMHVESLGIDWGGLYDFVAASSEVPSREQAMRIIRETPEWISRNGRVVDGRKRQLQMLASGRSWKYMSDHFFAHLRRAQVEIVGQNLIPQPHPVQPDTVVVSQRDTLVVMHRDTVVVMHRDTVVMDCCKKHPKDFFMALKTNMLYDAALIPNIGIEFYLGKGWSIGANWMYAWWKNDPGHVYWRTYGGDLNVRKYLGRRAQEKPLTGHHIGIYGQILTYDFETGKRGYLGDRWSYGGGFEYGYALPIGRRLNLDFSLGVGYFGGKYKVYDPQDGCYVWKATRQRNWIGPTKAEVSLVWLIGRGNFNTKGGDKR